MEKVKEIEIPRYTVPGYLEKLLSTDFYEATPGHRFLLYFHGASYKARLKGERKEVKDKGKDLERRLDHGEWKNLYKQYRPSDWNPLKDSKIYALKSVRGKSEIAKVLTEALQSRQAFLAEKLVNQVEPIKVKLTAPLATGLGNPHPVENGFSFLSPYGIPYLPGSGIKGAVRRAAEELALFDESSDWSIPLVWLLFGFETSSAYLAPLSKLEAVDVVQKEAEHWRGAFGEYAEKQAEADKVLRYWLSLEAVKSSIPEELQHLTERPFEFCKTLQGSDKLRKAISWQGLVRFWDVFFDTDFLDVDILNPHHKDYYEGKGPPHDAESPKPVFFLTVPAGTEFTVYCQLSRKIENFPIDDCRELIHVAVKYACEWIGFGAKTAVGYGVSLVGQEVEDDKEQGVEGSKEKREEIQKEDHKTILEEFEIQVSQSKNLPGEINTFLQKVRFQGDIDLRKKMCLILLKKANSLKKDKKFSKALKNSKSWAVRLKELLEENGIDFQNG